MCPRPARGRGQASQGARGVAPSPSPLSLLRYLTCHVDLSSSGPGQGRALTSCCRDGAGGSHQSKGLGEPGSWIQDHGEDECHAAARARELRGSVGTRALQDRARGGPGGSPAPTPSGTLTTRGATAAVPLTWP